MVIRFSISPANFKSGLNSYCSTYPIRETENNFLVFQDFLKKSDFFQKKTGLPIAFSKVVCYNISC